MIAILGKDWPHIKIHAKDGSVVEHSAQDLANFTPGEKKR